MAGGVFSTAKVHGMTIRESANDGSDFTNPDADYRRLFLGEDGQLHVKDSAGAVTDIGTATTADHNHTTAGGDGGDLDSPVIDGHAIFNEEAAPSTPASGTVALYAKSDGRIYSKDDAGNEFGPFDASGGGGGDSAFAAAVVAHADAVQFWPLSEAYGDGTYANLIGAEGLADFGSHTFRGINLCRDAAHPISYTHLSASSGLVKTSALTWPAAWTMMGWVVFLGASGSDTAVWGQWNGSGHMLHWDASHNLTAYFGGSSAVSWAAGTAELANGGPRLVSVVHDGTDGYLYVDATLRDSATVTGPTGTHGAQFGVGLYSGSGTNGVFMLQMLCMFDVALSQPDIQDFYDLGAPL